MSGREWVGRTPDVVGARGCPGVGAGGVGGTQSHTVGDCDICCRCRQQATGEGTVDKLPIKPPMGVRVAETITIGSHVDITIPENDNKIYTLVYANVNLVSLTL